MVAVLWGQRWVFRMIFRKSYHPSFSWIVGPLKDLSRGLFIAGLQCCAALAPADLYVNRILERFGLSSYLSLNPEWSSSMFLIFPFLSWSDFLRFMFLCAMYLHLRIEACPCKSYYYLVYCHTHCPKSLSKHVTFWHCFCATELHRVFLWLLLICIWLVSLDFSPLFLITVPDNLFWLTK